jgi:two-component system phosphate regulon response regulator PhoB
VTDKHKILVVDDDLFVRRPLEAALQQEGFDAITAADGPSCLALLEQDPPDLIILDIVMPGPDGFEVCKTIKSEARYARIPVILMSARNRGDDRERGLDLGATDFLTKPYPPRDLLRRVREILADA